MDIRAKLQELVDLIVTTGVAADIDNQKLNAPCAYVHPGPIVARDLADGYTMTAQVTLIARNTSNAGNLDALQTMLTAVLTELEPDGPIETDRTAQVADKLLPAFTFPIQIDL